MPITQRYEPACPIEQLSEHPDNPRRGDEAAIDASMSVHGFYGAVLAQESTGHIIAGNHRTRVARRRGETTIPALFLDVDDDQARRLLLVDNRSNDLAGYDDAELARLLASLDDLDGTGFTDTDLNELLDSLQMPPAPVVGDPDAVPDSAPALTALGDVWQLGAHRLVCGDAADGASVARALDGATAGCLLTDPPYGIDLMGESSGKILNQSGVSGSKKAMLEGVPGRTYRPILGDDQPFDAAPIRAIFAGTSEQFWFGADYYRRTLGADDLDGSWLVWDKRTEDSDPGFGSGFELIWSARRHKRDLLRVWWFGTFGDADARNRLHPTQKPTRLLSMILDRWAPVDCVVADPFAGSGSTLIAAELTGRRAALVELDPGYCDVICRRFEQATGVVPVRAGTGEACSFIA
jgi:hypothetical protein